MGYYIIYCGVRLSRVIAVGITIGSTTKDRNSSRDGSFPGADGAEGADD
jgi:hypothetical protein